MAGRLLLPLTLAAWTPVVDALTQWLLDNSTASIYALVGAALFGLTMQKPLARRFHINLPALYVIIGIMAAFVGAAVLSPLADTLQAKVITHASELIVIVSLTGAGLAIDTKMGWRKWNATWRLLGVAMPATIIALIFMGQWAGLSLAAAVLLGASLAPTDPVLARSVQVEGPGEGEDTTSVGLTAEAGLNDGLAFPFVWAAIALAAGTFSWTSFIAYDVIYRIVVGCLIGWAAGWLVAKLIFSKMGDGRNGRDNPLLVMLAATFIAYGLAEFVHAYGFLSVFIAARTGRNTGTDPDMERKPEDSYTNRAHEEADQFESMMMVLLLLWFGTFVGAELWHRWQWSDLLIALALLLVVRPVAGWLALIGHGAAPLERFKMAFFGIRGMGTIFYIAYAQTHMPGDMAFPDVDAVWRIAGLCIFISVIMHESLAGVLFNRSNRNAIPTGASGPAPVTAVRTPN